MPGSSRQNSFFQAETMPAGRLLHAVGEHRVPREPEAGRAAPRAVRIGKSFSSESPTLGLQDVAASRSSGATRRS